MPLRTTRVRAPLVPGAICCNRFPRFLVFLHKIEIEIENKFLMLESFRHRGPGSIKGKRVCHSSDLHASTNERTQRGRGLSAPSLSSHGQVLAARYDDYADHEQAARMQKSEECVGHTCIRRGSMPRWRAKSSADLG